MDVSKNVFKMYLIIFFHNLIPAYVIERLFYQQRGISVIMVVLFEIIYASTIVVLEIPTGILADKFGRKTLLVIGAVLAMLEFIILLFAYDIWAFIGVALLAGISSACTSGSNNALLYDSLLMVNKEDSFEKIIGRLNTIDFIGAILAALLGSILAKLYGFEFNYFLSSISMFIALVVTILLVEPSRIVEGKEENSEKFSIRDYFINSLSFYRNNTKLIFVITHAMAIGACVNYLDEFWQLYLNEIGYSILFFGIFSATMSLARIPGNLFSGYLIKYLKVEHIILSVLAITTLGFFVSSTFHGMVGIVAIIFIFLASGVVEPVVAGYLHHNTSSDIRATVDSIQSLIERGITSLIGIGFGAISSGINVITGFAFLGVMSLVFFLLFLCKGMKR